MTPYQVAEAVVVVLTLVALYGILREVLRPSVALDFLVFAVVVVVLVAYPVFAS